MPSSSSMEMVASKPFAGHNYELTECGSTVLCIDYALNGIGSNSCGPEVADKYKFNENEFDFSFVLVPYKF